MMKSIFSRFLFVGGLFCLGLIFPAQAENLDTVRFGDEKSQTDHAMDAHFPPRTPPSNQYKNPSASEPSDTPPTKIIDGALGQKAIQMLSRTPVPDMNGGEITLTMKVDPHYQNYFSAKFWGSDPCDGLIILYCNGHELGARHGLEETGFSFMLANGAWFKDRFWYRTARLPLYLTYGHDTVEIKLRWTGSIYYYAGLFDYKNYQHLTRADHPSPAIYRAYTHLGSYVETEGEEQAPVPPEPPLRAKPGAEVMDQFKHDLNSWVKDRLRSGEVEKGNPYEQPSQALMLAQAYHLTWSSSYQDPHIPDTIVALGDKLTKIYSTKGEVPGAGFGANSGPWGEAIKLVWPQIQDKMEETVNYGGKLGSTTRKEAWATFLRANLDNQRFDRKKIFNQELDGDFHLYQANLGLELVDPSKAFTEEEALRYVKEGMGILPWAGNDLPDEPGHPHPMAGKYPNGPHWYTSTSRGTLKDGSYMPTGDYGEVGASCYAMWLLTKDEEIHQRALTIAKARLPFRFPSTDQDGFQVMTVSEPIGSRNKDLPGHDAYLSRDTGAILVATENDPDLVGGFQQMVQEGQLYAFLKKGGLDRYTDLHSIENITAALAQPPSPRKLPMADGMPDFAWGDEDNMVVAAKHGQDRLFAALARDFVNGSAIVFLVTPQVAHLSEVQEDDVQYQSSGQFKVLSGDVDQWDWASPSDNKNFPNAMKDRRQPIAVRPDMVGVDLASYKNQDGGRACSYTLRYGHFLIGMNMDARYNKESYRVKTPGDFTSGIDLVTGKTLSAPVVIAPGTTVVFYLPNVSSPNPLPSSPLVFTGKANGGGIDLDWDPSSGAVTYNVKRSDTPGGPYTTVGENVNDLKYTDRTTRNGTTYYYVLTGVGVTGESDPSPEFKVIVH